MSETKREELKPKDFSINGMDNSGMRIKKIYYKTPEYVVYRTENSIRIDIDDNFEHADEYLAEHNKLGVNLARVYSWLPEKLSWSEAINRQIARAIAVNVKGDHDKAIEMLVQAEDRVKQLKTIQGRLQYTLSSFLLAAIMLCTVIIFDFISLETYLLYSKIALCASFGGVLSVVIGYSNLEIDLDANKRTNCMIGASRICISIIAGLFSYFAVKSGIAFTIFSEIEGNKGIYLIAMISGFSEMLVPKIMNNLAEQTNK